MCSLTFDLVLLRGLSLRLLVFILTTTRRHWVPGDDVLSKQCGVNLTMRMHRRVAWNITTFDPFVYVERLDRFFHQDDLPNFRGLTAGTTWVSSHSRLFRTKAKMLKFLNSDTRCPVGGAEGWIVMRVTWRGGHVWTGEYAVMKKPN